MTENELKLLLMARKKRARTAWLTELSHTMDLQPGQRIRLSAEGRQFKTRSNTGTFVRYIRSRDKSHCVKGNRLILVHIDGCVSDQLYNEKFWEPHAEPDLNVS